MNQHDHFALEEARALIHDVAIRHPESLPLLSMVETVEHEINRVEKFVAFIDGDS